MPKFFHSFCCCVRPNAYAKKTVEVTEPDGRLGVQSPLNHLEKKHPSPHPSQTHRKQKKPKQRSSSGNRKSLTSRYERPANNKRDTTERHSKKLEENGVMPGSCLLPRSFNQDHSRKCLIVDLDETLVHSSFKPVKNADFIIPVEIDNVVHQVYVLKRPNTDAFLERIGSLFECVLFTASLAKYADPVSDILDHRRIFRTRLFREACVYHDGNYVKDLNKMEYNIYQKMLKLGRDLTKVIIIDNSPASYAFHPNNAISVKTWFDDPEDTELLEIIPLLEDLAASDDIYSILGARCPRPSLPQAHPLDGDSNNNTNEQIFSGQRTYDTNVIHQTPRPSDSSPITQCLPTTRIVVPSDQYNSNGDGWRRTVPAPTTRLLIDAPPGQLSNSTNKPYTSPINSSSLARPMTNSTPIHSTVRIRMLDDENREHRNM